MYDKIVDDFGTSARVKERIIRLDPYGTGQMAGSEASRPLFSRMSIVGGGGVGAGAAGLPLAMGLEDLDLALRDCVKASFQSRLTCYMDEVRRGFCLISLSNVINVINRPAQARALLNQRLEPGWSFASFYLVKDSLALLLETGGLHEDAYYEHMELEACYMETLAKGTAEDFGASYIP